MIKLPPRNQWQVDNTGEILGHLNYTQGLNFDFDGYLKNSTQTVSIQSSSDDANFGLPLKTLFFNNDYFVLTDQDCWEITQDLVFNNITDAESNAPDPNNGSDAVVWQDRVYVSSDTTTGIRYWSGTAWTDPSISLGTSLTPHPMAVMGNFSNGHLVVGENNTVKRYNTSHSLVTTLTLNDNHVVTGMIYRNSILYISTKTNDGGEAKLFIWNGSGTSATREYGAGTDWIFSIAEYDSSIVIVTNEGELLRFNNGGFDQLAVFPVFNTEYRWSNNVTNLLGKVGMNGMIADGDLLYINVSGAVGAGFTLDKNGTTESQGDSLFLPNQPSGLWCFDPKIGLYCRNLHSRSGHTQFTASALNSDTLTLSADTNAKTGDPILVLENGSLTGVFDDTLYYVIKVTDNQVKLANTPSDAHAGTALSLGGSVTSATFLALDYTQIGDLLQFGKEAGGMGLIHTNSGTPTTPIFPNLFELFYLWGFEDDDSVTHLCISSRSPGTGIFSTVKVFASGIKDSWNKIYTIFRDFYGDSARIIVRAKTKERQSLPTSIMYGTYSTTERIGTADNLLDLAEAGDCVIILSGNGAGNARTIKSISGDEIVFSESVTGVSSGDDIIFYIDSFKEYGRATSSTSTVDDGYIETAIGKSSTWVEFLIEVRGTMKIPEMRIVNKPHKETN